MTRRLSRPLLVALALALASGTARAQGGVWTQVPVPAATVAGIADGDSGQVLIAGSIGAYRFDGFRRVTLPIFSPATDSLVGKAMLRAGNGDIWFAYLTGVARLRPDGSVTHFDAGDGVGNSASSEATCLAEALDGAILVGTKDGGLSRFDGNAWTTLTTDQGMPSQQVSSVAVDPRDGSLWVGCLGGNGGLAHVVGATITRIVPTATITPNVRAVTVTPSGVVWIGTDAGVGRFQNGTLTEYSAGTAITSVAEGAHGEVWVGSGTRGVGRFDNGAITFLPSGPPSNSVQSLYVDPAGVLWAGTTAGLGRYEGAAVLNHSSATGLPASFFALCALRDPARDAPGDSIDSHGVGWIGMQQSPGSPNLLRRVNGRLRLLGSAEGLPTGNVQALARADSGQAWIATSSDPGSGVARISLEGQVLASYGAELASTDVFALETAGSASAWAGTRFGVALIDGTGVRALRTGTNAVPDAPIRGVDLDAQGRLWIATGVNPTPVTPDPRPGAGAVRFDPADSSFTLFDTVAGLPTNNLTSVAAFSNGDVWFGSALGAIRLRGNQVTLFDASRGLPSNTVLRVVEGRNGEAWIATSAGLVQLDGADRTVYGVGDGFAGSAINNVFADSLGVIATLRTDGVAFFRPDRTPPRAEILTAPAAVTGTRDAAFSFRGGDLDSGSRGILMAWQLDLRPITLFVEDATSFRPPDPLTDGTHTFRLWAKDRALNVTPDPTTWTFEVDATPPRPIVAQPAFNQVVKGTVDVIGSVADARFAGYTIELRPQGVEHWDTLLVSPDPPPSDTLYRWNTAAGFDGVWELRVGSVDSLGLIGYVQVTTIVDNLAPNASVTAPAKVDHVLGGKVFTTDGGIEIDIPPNAFAADQIVSIDPLAQPALPGGMPPGAIWGPSYLVHAGDMALDKPATLTFRLSGIANTPTAIYRVLADTSVVLLGGVRTPDGASISTTLSDLGGVVVLFGQNVAAGVGFDGTRALDVQPRVLSPNGGGFDTRAAISFEVGKAGSGAVKVFDRAGRLVREVSENDAFAPGRNVVFWDGRDGDGQVVPSGIYVVAVRFDGQTQVASVAVANR